MKYFIGAITAILLAVGIISIASAQQPRSDEVDIDLIGCTGGVIQWIDGTQVSQKIVVSNNDTGLPIATIALVDTVGDQGGDVYTFTAPSGTEILAQLYVDDEVSDSDSATVPACPTATPTNTATPTATSTATPVPTSTPAVLTPIPTATQAPPQIIVQQVPVYVDRVVTQTITPPSTGDGGILIRE